MSHIQKDDICKLCHNLHQSPSKLEAQVAGDYWSAVQVVCSYCCHL